MIGPNSLSRQPEHCLTKHPCKSKKNITLYLPTLAEKLGTHNSLLFFIVMEAEQAINNFQCIDNKESFNRGHLLLLYYILP